MINPKEYVNSSNVRRRATSWFLLSRKFSLLIMTQTPHFHTLSHGNR